MAISKVAAQTIAFCVCVALCEGLDLQAAGVAASGIAAEYTPAPEQFGTFFSASTFGLFLGALLGGRLADSIGRKRVLVTSVAVFGGFSLLTALAWDMPSLTGARLLTGLGLGGALPILLALVSESSGATRRGANVAMVYAATPVGGAIASLTSLLIAAPHWRLIFVLGGILPLLLAPIMLMKLRESAAYEGVRQDYRRIALPKRGSFVAIFADGRAIRTVLLWVSFFFALLLLYLLLNWLPILLVSGGLTRPQAAEAQIGFNLGGAAAALGVGHLLAGRFRFAVIVITFLLLPIFLIALAVAPAKLGLLALFVLLLGGAVMAAQAILYSMAPIAYPVSIRGVGVGAAVAMGRVGSIVGPKLGGYLKSAGHTPSQLLLDLLPLVTIGSVCALLLAWVSVRKHYLARAD